MTVHLAERDAELVGIWTILVAHEIRAFVVQQNEIRNIIFAYGLVLGHLGLPKLGIAGAGLATSTAEWVGAGVLLVAKRDRLARDVSIAIAVERSAATLGAVGGSTLLTVGPAALAAILLVLLMYVLSVGTGGAGASAPVSPVRMRTTSSSGPPRGRRRPGSGWKVSSLRRRST